MLFAHAIEKKEYTPWGKTDKNVNTKVNPVYLKQDSFLVLLK